MQKSSSIISQEQWDMIIRPKRSWWDLRLGELWRYRDLIRLFMWRDFVAVYKQTILGPLWYVIQPVLTTGVFTVIFGNIARLPTDGLPPFVFYMAGNTVWSYFNACLMSTSNTFVDNAALFGKVYFPRLAVPVSVIISNLVSFVIRLAVFLAFLLYFVLAGASVRTTVWVLLVPFLVLIMAGLGLGFGIIISSLTTKYRDLRHLVSFGAQLLMYASPVIYPLSTAQGVWRWMILANPMTPVIELFRLAFLGVSALNPVYLLYSVGFMLVVLMVGLLTFHHVESTFMDTV